MKTNVIHIPAINQDITFILGEHAKDNDQLIEQSNQDDLWFHVKNKSSCHVVAHVADQAIERKQMKYVIKQGALLCKIKSYPSERNLPIIYTKIKNIQSTDIPGQVTLRNDPSTITI